MKKVQDKKQRDAEAAEAERKAKKEADMALAVEKAIQSGASPEEANKIVEEKEKEESKKAENSALSAENENEDDGDVVF